MNNPVAATQARHQAKLLQILGAVKRLSPGFSGQWLKYFSAPEPIARAIHAEIYRCWSSALDRMSPLADVPITVDADAGFSVNGSFVAYRC